MPTRYPTGGLLAIAALAAAGIALDLHSQDRAYDDKAAFRQRLGLEDTDELPDTSTVEVSISTTAVRFPLGDLTISLPARDGDLTALRNSVVWARDQLLALGRARYGFGVAFEVDHDVPYGILVKVVRTVAAEADFGRYAVRNGDQVTDLDEPEPDHWPPRFHAKLGASGIVVGGDGMPNETLPNLRGHYDFAALTEAGNRWKAAARENVSENGALVTAEAEVPWEDLLRAEEALRVEGTFPQARWGIERRLDPLEQMLLQQLAPSNDQ